MMISAMIILRKFSLRVNRTPKLTAPHHQRLFKEAAFLEIAQKTRRRLVDIFALPANLGRQIAMLIPPPMIQLDEWDATFRQPSGNHTVPCKTAGRLHSVAIPRECLRGLVTQVHQFWNTRLHSVGHLILGDPRLGLCISEFIETLFVDGGQRIQHLPPIIAVHAFRIIQKQHRIVTAAKFNPLMFGREKAAPPESRVQCLQTSFTP